ncbi:MAG: Cys-every-fifth RiPP peptide CefA [Planctomycetota bacterium]
MRVVPPQSAGNPVERPQPNRQFTSRDFFILPLRLRIRKLAHQSNIQNLVKKGLPHSACPVSACPVSACPVSACPVSACPVSACPVSACPVSACPVSACPVSACPVSACPSCGMG